MGCWNGTCAISNLHVLYGQEVMVLLLAKNKKEGSFCYSDSLYQLVPLPFYGEYNDYGAVENCHGILMDNLVSQVKEHLFEMEMGTNEYHDLSVKKEDFNLEKFFLLDHKGRLGIHNKMNNVHYQLHDMKELEKTRKLTENEQIIKTKLLFEAEHPDTFQRLTHIIVHKKVADDILEKYYFNEYSSDGYTKVYLKDILSDLDVYIQAFQKKLAEDEFVFDLDVMEYRTNRAQDFIDSATRSHKFFTPLFSNQSIIKWIKNNEKEMLTEMLKAMWLNFFMNENRRLWVKPSGVGSQEQSDYGHRLLAQSVVDVLDEEKRRYEEENEE